MIPLQLHIKNFLSYGSPTQTINFEPYHLICLSGKNGHGKSALLDALTWALWGQARKTTGTSKADDGLLRLGQTSMVVSFDFQAHHHTYRVRREYSLDRGKATTQLDFGIIDSASNKLRPLTDKTLRATQDSINKTIGLDYDAFINSVFLRQGQSNEFSKKSPKDRKEILVNILGLAHYEMLRKRALEKMRDEKLQSDHLQARIIQLAAVVTQLPEKQTALMQLREHYTQLTARLGTLNEQLHKHADYKKELLQKQHEALKLETEQVTLIKQLEKIREELRHTINQWRESHKKYLLHTRTRTTESIKQLQEEFNQLQEKINRQLQLTNESMVCKDALQKIEATLQKNFFEQEKIYQKTIKEHEQRIHALQQELTTLTTTQTHLEQHAKLLAQEYAMLTEQTKNLREISEKLTIEDVLFERRKRFYHTFVARGNQRAYELKDSAHKQELASDSNNPSCALCEQNLSASRRRFLQNKFDIHQHRLNHQLNRLTAVIKNLKDLLTTQHAALIALRTQVHDATQAHTRAQEVQVLITDNQIKIIEITERIARVAHDISLAQTTLTSFQQSHGISYEQYRDKAVDYTTHKQQEFTLQALLAAEQFDEQRYLFIKQELAHFAAGRQENNEATYLTLQHQRREKIKQLVTELRQLQQQRVLVTEQHTKYAQLPQQLSEHDTIYEKMMLELKQLHEQKDVLSRTGGGLEQECKQLEAYQQQHTQLQKEQEALITSQDDYTVLAQAFSKDGIQGLLIEHILPELEAEANELLSRLTNNQAHITIESMRDLKGGGSRETLDIKISDALGIRPYEMFSGGEAFRIDFALRLALSKLLARRTGTALQTLIIDEGFGSQDDEGLQHIMEALYAIQEDFAKIIIVSHLPTMKDQFPVHFVVQKTPRGSIVQAIEQG